MPILKILSRRQLSAIEHTLNYITREGSGVSKPLLHNLRSSMKDRDALVNEFIVNEAYRKITSNRIYCYHSILSLSDLDKKQATPKVMQAIAQKYLDLRGDILAVVVPHNNTDSPHLHILESATLYREGKSSGLRKQELHNLKMELEYFIQERFPELENSGVEHGKGKPYVKEPEIQLLNRKGTSEREQLQKLIQNAYSSANSKQQFLDILQDQGYLHYQRNSDGIPTGLLSESGRKYRFKTLGLSFEKIMELESKIEKQQEEKLLNQLKEIRQHKAIKNREL